MESQDVRKLGQELEAAMHEWTILFYDHLEAAGRENPGADGEFLKAVASRKSREGNPELWDKLKELQGQVTGFHAAAAHAMAEMQVRFEESEKHIEELRKKDQEKRRGEPEK